MERQPESALGTSADTAGLDGDAGPALALLLEQVGDDVVTGGRRLSAFDAVSFIVAASREVARLQALAAFVTAALTTDPLYAECDAPPTAAAGRGRSRGHRHSALQAVGMEVSAATSTSVTFATDQVAWQRDLVEHLPDTWRAWAAGHIDTHRARVIAEETAAITLNPDLVAAAGSPELSRAALSRTEPQPSLFAEPGSDGPADDAARADDTPAGLARRVRGEVERAVLGRAGQQTAFQVRRRTKRLVLSAVPGLAADKRERFADERQVHRPRMSTGTDAEGLAGVGGMSLVGPAVGAPRLLRTAWDRRRGVAGARVVTAARRA